MRVDMRVVLPVLVLCASLALDGKDKKSILPTYVLNAQTVLVLIDPEAGTPMNAPLANKTAQDDVEKALMKWGRLKPVLDGYTADLVITVRKGSDKVVQPTVGGLPTNDRPVIVQPTDSGIRLGGQKGQPPGTPDSTRTAPGPQVEVAPREDVFAVYEGRVDAPLERSPVWRYARKDALRSPSVPAVEEFRKAIEEAEKQQQQQQQQQKQKGKP
jgi:hypothetical protein